MSLKATASVRQEPNRDIARLHGSLPEALPPGSEPACLRSATRFHNYLNRFGDVESTPESAGLEFAPRLLIPSGFQDPPSTVPNS